MIWRTASGLLLLIALIPASGVGRPKTDEVFTGCVPAGWNVAEVGGRTSLDAGDAHLVVQIRRLGQQSPVTAIDGFAAAVQSAAADRGVTLSRARGRLSGGGQEGGWIAIPRGPVLVIAGGWASAERWGSVEPQMESIARCYGE